jgi:hypothetical protein
MTKQEFIGEYLEKNKAKLKLPYGLAYYNMLAKLEAEAEKKWNKLKKRN